MIVWFFQGQHHLNARALRQYWITTPKLLVKVINFDKSSIFFGTNTSSGAGGEIKKIFGLEDVSHHKNYLGLPSMLGKSKYSFFGSVKEIFLNKIKNWKTRFFSIGGKEILIKAVAQAVPTYATSMFWFPTKLCNEIQGLLSKFWWDSNSTSKGIDWLPWKKLCRPKNVRGLGFRKLSAFNGALLANQGWRIVIDPNSLWRVNWDTTPLTYGGASSGVR